MNILILYLQNKNEKINLENLSFIKNIKNNNDNDIDNIIYLRDINKELKQKNTLEYNIYFYNDTFFNLNIITNLMNNYDFLLFLDDSVHNIINLNKYIKKASEILNTNNSIDQVLFYNLTTDYSLSKINTVDIQYPLIDNLELDNYNIYERINQVILNKNNPYPKSELKKMNYLKYLNKDYPFLNFRLLPSLIRYSKLLSTGFNLYKNDHFEYIYSKKLEKHNFKSCYIKYNLNKINNNNNLLTINNDNGSNTTLVTAYIKLDFNRPSKKPSQKYDYIKKSYDTLSLNHNMIIYVSKELIDDIINFRTKLGLIDKTKIIEVDETNLYLYNKLNIIEENIKKNWKPYDMAKYILAVNSRYNFVKDAIENNYFKTDYFGWIDFAASHTVNIPSNFKINYSKIDKIRISWIARIRNNMFVYNHKCIGGGIFVGHKEIMLEFIRIHDIEFQNLMNMGYCINDDKLLFLIYEKYPYLFDIYFSSYSTMLTRIN